jgi:hypothetical protein
VAKPSLCSTLGGEPSELDQPGLVRRQLQVELRQPFGQLSLEASRITLVLEPDDDVISEAHDDHVTPVYPGAPAQ